MSPSTGFAVGGLNFATAAMGMAFYVGGHSPWWLGLATFSALVGTGHVILSAVLTVQEGRA